MPHHRPAMRSPIQPIAMMVPRNASSDIARTQAMFPETSIQKWMNT